MEAASHDAAAAAAAAAAAGAASAAAADDKEAVIVAVTKDLEAKVAALVASSVTSSLDRVKAEVKTEAAAASEVEVAAAAAKEVALIADAKKEVESRVMAQAEASVSQAKADLEKAVNEKVIALQVQKCEMVEWVAVIIFVVNTFRFLYL